MEPLQYPDRQIRLLRFLPQLPAAENDSIRCEMSVHDFDSGSTPDYKAVSYAWGSEENAREILVNRTSRPVRNNCQYALWQARYHYPDSYIWIDALSIDQASVEEKSIQVQMMGAIFGRAKMVLACIGPDADDSEFMFSFSPEFTEQAFRARGNHTYWTHSDHWPATNLDCEIIWTQWQETKSRAEIERFIEACTNFSNREYWDRLWILQELAIARTTKILCGKHQVPWTIMGNLYIFMNFFGSTSLWGSTFCAVVSIKPGVPIESEYAYDLQHFKCTDVRDRIYGTLNLFTWKGSRLNITPDYSISPFELAKSLARLLMPFEYLARLFAILELDMRCPEISALTAERRDLLSTPYTNRSLSGDYRIPLQCCCLQLDEQNRLICSDLARSGVRRDEMLLDMVSGGSAGAARLGENREPGSFQRVWQGRTVVALLGRNARVGDYLAKPPFPFHGICIVLRSQDGDGNIYSIVGQAIVFTDHFSSGAQIFETTLDEDDVLCFFCQDVTGPWYQNYDPDEDDGYDPVARLHRLDTKISLQQNPIAFVVDDNNTIEQFAESDTSEESSDDCVKRVEVQLECHSWLMAGK